MKQAVAPSLIINTYNQAAYLGRVLQSISRQVLPPQEVLAADDGSADETGQIFAAWAKTQPFRCEHVLQEHQGFRRSRILNQAIARTRGEHLVFLDGDTVVHPRFLEDHAALARPGAFIQGHRALIEQKAAKFFGTGDFQKDRRRALWQGQLRGLKHAYRWPLPMRRRLTHLRGVRGCNLAIWREDLVKVNGYNEAFVGWGREDSELVLRLLNSGIQRMDVRGWALCYHLWHPPASRSELPKNDQLLEEAIQSGAKTCALGLSQYIR